VLRIRFTVSQVLPHETGTTLYRMFLNRYGP